MNRYYPLAHANVPTDGGTNMHIFGALCMFFFLVALLALVIWLVMRSRHSTAHQGKPSSKALEILDERFAKGEIDVAEYEERKKILRS